MSMKIESVNNYAITPHEYEMLNKLKILIRIAGNMSIPIQKWY